MMQKMRCWRPMVLSWLVVLAVVWPMHAADKLPDTPKSPEPAPSAGDAAQFEHDAAAFRKLVTDLAAPEMEGRGPGTKGLDKARDYLVHQFKSLGLEPAFAQPGAGAGRRSFTEPFQISAGIRAQTQTLVLADAKGGTIIKPRPGEQFAPRGFSGNGKFDGPAVFVGYGIVNPQRKYDSYHGAGKDALKGKVAVAYRYEPMTKDGKSQWMNNAQIGQWSNAASLLAKAKWASEHGASALIVVNPPSQEKDGRIPSTMSTQAGRAAALPIVQVSRDVFYTMLRQAGKGDASVDKALQKKADQGQTAPMTLANVTLRGEFKLTRTKASVQNVAAYLPGDGKLKDQVIVIGGHYDHLGHGGPGALGPSGEMQIYHGADDNASGTSGVVMLARRFAAQLKNPSRPNHEDRRTLLFVCFTGEERGLLGSAYMLKHIEDLGIKTQQIVAMLNMDMIGRMRNNKLLVIGVGSGDKFESLVTEAAKGLDLTVSPSASAGGGSDHMSFHAKKIPALHVFTGIHKDYHRPTDTADKINAEGGIKTVYLLAGIIDRLWRTDMTIAFKTVRMAHGSGGGPRGSGAYLGVLPDYASLDSNDGCAINDVTAGSPAAMGGLKGGDVIIRWDKKTVHNLQGLSDVLKASKPGQTVTVRVKRGNKVVDLKVKLGTR